MFPTISDNRFLSKTNDGESSEIGFADSIRWLWAGMVSSRPKGSAHSTYWLQPSDAKAAVDRSTAAFLKLSADASAPSNHALALVSFARSERSA
jgi:hypothetical protein